MSWEPGKEPTFSEGGQAFSVVYHSKETPINIKIVKICDKYNVRVVRSQPFVWPNSTEGQDFGVWVEWERVDTATPTYERLRAEDP